MIPKILGLSNTQLTIRVHLNIDEHRAALRGSDLTAPGRSRVACAHRRVLRLLLGGRGRGFIVFRKKELFDNRYVTEKNLIVLRSVSTLERQQC